MKKFDIRKESREVLTEYRKSLIRAGILNLVFLAGVVIIIIFALLMK